MRSRAGRALQGLKQAKHKRARIPIHDRRREAATEAGFGSVGWHTFRHKYRTLLSEADTPLEVQQKLLRTQTSARPRCTATCPWRISAKPKAQRSGRFWF